MPLHIPKYLFIAGSAWVSRVVTAFVQLFSVRILMDSLGLENYAVFALLTGLAAWFMLADLGIGFSIQNYISESRVKNQSYDDLIFAGSLLAIILLFLTVILLYFISPIIAPILLRNIVFLSEKEKVKLLFLTGSLSIGFAVGGVVYKVWYAEQRGYLSNIVPAISSIVGLGCLLFLSQFPMVHRLQLSLIAVLAPPAAIPILVILLRQKRADFGRLKKTLIGKFKIIITRGLHFWLFAIMAACVLQVDYIILSQFAQASDIASYNLSTKIFGFLFYVYSAILLSLWPIFAESIARQEWGIVGGYLRKYLTIGIVFMIFSTLVLAWLMPFVLEILAPGKNVIAPVGLIVSLGLYQVIRVWTDTFAVILQSSSNMKPFWICVPIQGFLSIYFQWLLAPIFGVYGIVFGLIFSYLLTVSWVLPLSVWRSHK